MHAPTWRGEGAFSRSDGGATKGGRDIATIATQDANTAGLLPTYAAVAGGGDQVPNNGKVLLHVKNASNANINVTIGSQRACDQGSTHNTVVVVTNSASGHMIGPFTDRYTDANGYVQLAYSSATSVTIAAIDV